MGAEQQYVRYEREDAPEYWIPAKVRIFYRCNRCGHEYSRVAKTIAEPDAPCPKKACKDARLLEDRVRSEENRTAIIESRQMPGIVGTNPMVNVVDKTAEIVMADHGLTDLKDNLRPGDIMAPKLDPHKQQAADNFFTAARGVTGMNPRQANLLGRRAISGAYRGLAVAPQDVFPGQKGEKALWKVRDEKG